MNRKRLFAFLLTAAILISGVPATFAFDEGMYMPDQIAGLPLAKRGLKIKPSDIYNPNAPSLTDAVIRLSIGCTAEFVSPEGLILTNHHCGFDALVQASTPERDLVEAGFKADNRAGEISAKGYSLFITEREENVTARVLAGTEGLTGDALTAAIKTNTENIQSAEQAKAPAGSVVRVQSLNNGFYYYLFQTHQIKDIRVVYAPPRNIGVFGGDPDNFEWTRHTGDFTFLRAYTAPDGSAADYAPSNVPYKPKKYLTMNIGGIQENDFVFVLGYPGGTTRYRESYSIEYARDANFPFLADWLTALPDSLRAIGATDEEKRIKFQSDIANYDNSRKVFEGGELRLRRAAVVQKRQAEEAALSKWIAADPKRQQKYGTVLADLKSASAESNATMKRDVIFRRFPDPFAMVGYRQLYDAIATTVVGGKMLNDTERAAKLDEVKKAFEDREPAFELDMMKFFLRKMAELPEGQKFEPAEKMFGNLKGQARREAEAKFADSIVNGKFSTPEAIVGLYGPRTMEFDPEKEAIIDFTRGVIAEKNALAARSAKFGSVIGDLRLLYEQAMAEMKGITPYPDANSTLRFSYGNIKGYVPREAEILTPFTTLRGMIEKDTGKNPFDAPQKLIDLQNAGDFGRWGSGGTVALNFLSTTDIIGGNSGSPILNGKGEQVGICFDGNFEGLGNDFYYDPNVNRTISVDIRYILFVTEKFGNAGWIVDEMKLTGGKTAKAKGGY